MQTETTQAHLNLAMRRLSDLESRLKMLRREPHTTWGDELLEYARDDVQRLRAVLRKAIEEA